MQWKTCCRGNQFRNANIDRCVIIFLGQGSCTGNITLWWTIMCNSRKKSPAGKSSDFFLQNTLKNCILNEKFKPYMTTIRVFLHKIRTLFSNFWKNAEEVYVKFRKIWLKILTDFFRQISSFVTRNFFLKMKNIKTQKHSI